MTDTNFDPVVRLYQLPKLIGISSTTIWRAIQRGDLPAPLELGPRSRGYRRSTIDTWLSQSLHK